MDFKSGLRVTIDTNFDTNPNFSFAWMQLMILNLVFAISGLVIWKKGYLKMEGLRGKIKKNKI